MIYGRPYELQTFISVTIIIDCFDAYLKKKPNSLALGLPLKKLQYLTDTFCNAVPKTKIKLQGHGNGETVDYLAIGFIRNL